MLINLRPIKGRL